MIVRDLEGGGLEVLAPAKLNLYLEILGRRPDGYHELESLMVTVDLHDHLDVRDDHSGQLTFSCDDPSLPTNSANLVVRAAERLRAEAGVERGATLSLRKTIPSQAGLAGGSSDAAATLVALDRLWNLRTSPEQLESLAAEIGSDVAFFLKAPAAICRGRGERVESISPINPLHFVLVQPPFGVSTADVYRGLTPPPKPRSSHEVVQALREKDIEALGRTLFNRLQPVAESIEPRLKTIREALEDTKTLLDGHLMSGSGSAFFGLCRDEHAAGHAARTLGLLGLGRVRAVTCGP